MTNRILSRALPAILVLILIVSSVVAQTIQFTPLLSSQECRDLEFIDGMMYGALATGGMAVWDPADPSTFDRWTMMDGLTSNRLMDFAWTGRHLWVATDGGGLTRIDLAGTGPIFRQFASDDALAVAAVAGEIFGETERVYYGLVDGGIGVINNGFAGETFTSNGFPGLVSDEITALAFHGEDLWIGTADGVSELQQNLFVNRSAGLGASHVHALLVHDALGVVIATDDGVLVWDEDLLTWGQLGNAGGAVVDLTVLEGDIWALRSGTTVTDRLLHWSGGSWLVEDVAHSNVGVLGAADKIWIAGRETGPEGNHEATLASWSVRDASNSWNSWTSDDLLYNAVDGCEITDDGTIWLGSRVAAGWSGWDGSEWTQFSELASVDNDSLGLINFDSGLLSMDRGADGSLWITQFQGGGIIRYRPGIPDCDHITPDNSALSNHRIIRVMAHSDGPVIFMSDRFGVDVLIDPDHWRNPDSWITLPQDANGLGGLKFRDAAQTARDQIWLTSDDGGLVLWDPNGSADSNADLTWDDQSDDIWTEAVVEVTGSAYGFLGSKGLAGAPDGTLWAAGGGGVAHVELIGYGSGWISLNVLGTYRELIDPDLPGLMRGTVSDIDIDHNGDVWVCHDAGLNRIRLRGTDTFIDAYTNAGSYAAFGFGSLYSASIIAGIPEGTIREVAASSDGRRLIIGGDFGAAVLDIAADTGENTGPLDALYLHPNPFLPDEHTSGLKISGFESDVTVSQFQIEGGASVEIYNIEGQLIRRRSNIAPGDNVWDGINQDGEPAVTGTYLVRIYLRNHVVIKSLAVVR
jgi:hypothetical protein